tara:strand:+ start:692 stop:907 length:216 start_codon:yes stop_codon:yes gene_type:complete
MPNAQFIVSEILPAMQQALGATNVMAEARESAPNGAHFDAANPAATTPLIADAMMPKAEPAVENAVRMTFD